MKQVHTERKSRESGARAVLKGKHVVTGGDVLERVEEAEQARRRKQCGKRTKPEPQPEMSSSDEDIDETERAQPLEGELADCIVVSF